MVVHDPGLSCAEKWGLECSENTARHFYNLDAGIGVTCIAPGSSQSLRALLCLHQEEATLDYAYLSRARVQVFLEQGAAFSPWCFCNCSAVTSAPGSSSFCSGRALNLDGPSVFAGASGSGAWPRSCAIGLYRLVSYNRLAGLPAFVPSGAFTAKLMGWNTLPVALSCCSFLLVHLAAAQPRESYALGKQVGQKRANKTWQTLGNPFLEVVPKPSKLR